MALVYCNDNEKYLKVAREWTEKFATKEYVDDSEKLVAIYFIVFRRSKSTFPSTAN